jgi:hypothetical protein
MFAPSSDEELRALRRRCASSIWALVPRWVGQVFFRGLLWRTGPGGLRPRGEDLADHNQQHVGDFWAAEKGIKEGERTGDDDERFLAEIDEGILDVFSDEYCNKHLMYSALELILVRLMPELAEKGVVDLWEERLS